MEESEPTSKKSKSTTSDVQEKVYFYSDWDENRMENYSVSTHPLQNNRRDETKQKFGVTAHGQTEGAPGVITDINTRIKICFQENSSHTIGQFVNRSGLSRTGFTVVCGSIEGDFGGNLMVCLRFPTTEQLVANWEKVKMDFKSEDVLSYNEYKSEIRLDNPAGLLKLSHMRFIRAHKYYDLGIYEETYLQNLPKIPKAAFQDCIVFLKPDLELTEFMILKTVPMIGPYAVPKGQIEIIHKRLMPIFYTELRGESGFGSSDKKTKKRKRESKKKLPKKKKLRKQ